MTPNQKSNKHKRKDSRRDLWCFSLDRSGQNPVMIYFKFWLKNTPHIPDIIQKENFDKLVISKHGIWVTSLYSPFLSRFKILGNTSWRIF